MTKLEHDKGTHDHDPDDEGLLALLRAAGEGRQAIKLELYGDTDDDFVVALRGVSEWLNQRGILADNATLLYPGSSTHVGVARVFGRGNVIHIDPDEAAVEALQDHDYQAVASGIESYEPQEAADGMVALNSYGEPTKAMIDKLVRLGGVIVANNHTDWAHKLNDLPGIELLAMVTPSYMDPDAHLVEADDIPDNATEVGMQYFILSPGGRLSVGTPSNHTLKDESALYPDALFVFRRKLQLAEDKQRTLAATALR